MTFKPAKFRKNIELLTATAWAAIDEREILRDAGADEPPEEIGPLEAAIEERLEHAIRSMVAAIQFALEHKGARYLAELFTEEIENLSNLTETLPRWDDEGLGCESILLCWRYTNALLAGYECEPGDDFERERLARFLQNTAFILERDDVAPSSEGNVKKHLMKYLQASYPDVINEPSMAKDGVTFRGDTGVRGLNSQSG